MYIFHISSALWCTMYDLCYTMRCRAGGFILLNSDGFVVFLWDFHQKNIRLWNISLICLSMKLSYRPKYLQCFHGLVNYYILLPGLYMIGYGEQEKIFLNFEWGTSRAGNSKSNENKNVVFFFGFHLMFWIFPLLIFLVQSEERREFQNNFSFSVPYHIQP